MTIANFPESLKWSEATGPGTMLSYAYSINDPANVTDPSGLCSVAQNQPSDDSQQSGGRGGPNANDANVDTGSGGGQGPNGGPCYESLWDWLGGGSSLDGGDITDTSGGMGMSFSEGGGIVAASLGGQDFTLSFTAKAGVDTYGVNWFLNAYVALGPQSSSNANDNLQNGRVIFDSGWSPLNCSGIAAMLNAARRYPNYQVPYILTTSNSGARYLGKVGGFSPPEPPGSGGPGGWSVVIPGVEQQ